MRFPWLLLALASCGSEADPTIGSDRSLAPYVQRFEALWREADGPAVKVTVPVRLGTEEERWDSGELAHCRIWMSMHGLRREVTVREEAWLEATELRRHLTMEHELGHCELYREHSIERSEGGCPRSILYPWIDALEVCVRRHGAPYLVELERELFDHSKRGFDQ